MTLRTAHETGFGAAMSLSLASVLLGGELQSILWLGALVPWLVSYLRRRGQVMSTPMGTGIALIAFAYAGSLVARMGTEASLEAATIALIGIWVARLFTRITPSHDLQALVLSLLLVFAGTVLHQQFTYGVVLVLYAITVTWALVTRQLVEGAALEGWRRNDAALDLALDRRDVTTPRFFAVTAGVAVMILLATSVLFLLFPRVGLGGLGLQARGGNKLPARVSLLGTPRVAQGGREVVARLFGISYSDYVRGLYLRGSVYDALDVTGFSQSSTLSSVRHSKLVLEPAGRTLRYGIFLQPVTEQTLLTLGPVHAANVESGGFGNPSVRAHIVGVGPTGELLAMNPLSGPLRYSVTGSISTVHLAEGDDHAEPQAARRKEHDDLTEDTVFTQHFLALPKNLDSRIVALAKRTVLGADSREAQVLALRRYLLRDFSYTLTQPNSGKQDPLAGFLFDDRRGHCEYFATAFAVLLRAVGIPSRVVGGYQGGTWDDADNGLVLFTGDNAHAWVEWYRPGHGWRVDDATPAHETRILHGFAAFIERLRRTWDDDVVDYGIEQQLDILNGMASTLHEARTPADNLSFKQVALAFVGSLLLVGLWYVATNLPTRRAGAASPLAVALMEALRRLTQQEVDPAMTLREAVEKASGAPERRAQSPTLREALAFYEHLRFGSEAIAGSRAHQRHLIRALRRL